MCVCVFYLQPVVAVGKNTSALCTRWNSLTLVLLAALLAPSMLCKEAKLQNFVYVLGLSPQQQYFCHVTAANYSNYAPRSHIQSYPDFSQVVYTLKTEVGDILPQRT